MSATVLGQAALSHSAISCFPVMLHPLEPSAILHSSIPQPAGLAFASVALSDAGAMVAMAIFELLMLLLLPSFNEAVESAAGSQEEREATDVTSRMVAAVLSVVFM